MISGNSTKRKRYNLTLTFSFCKIDRKFKKGLFMFHKTVSIAFASITIFSATTSIAFADVNKGQKYYLKECKECHGNGTKGAAMLEQAEWKDMFANGNKEMITAHEESNNEKAKKYINSDKFKEHAQDLFDFLHEYAKDSGKVPSCG